MQKIGASTSNVQLVKESESGDMMSAVKTHTYGYRRDLSIPFTTAVERIYITLKEQGFGVLTEIDLKEKFREKLGVDFRDYVILGACNPALAHESLLKEVDLGLLLPCNIIVYGQEGGAAVAAIDAKKMLAVTGNEELVAAAEMINERLRLAIDAV